LLSFRAKRGILAFSYKMFMRLGIAIFCIWFVVLGCRRVLHYKKDNSTEIASPLFIDTTKFAILNSSEAVFKLFDSSYSPTNLNVKEFFEMKMLLTKNIYKNNFALEKEDFKFFGVDTIKYDYKMQIIPALNNKGEKEVWINAACHFGPDWRTHIELDLDHYSNCHFL
jgi:hypothetical protein